MMNFVFNGIADGNYTSISINSIPETGFFDFLNDLNSAMSDALSAFLPDSGILALFAKFPLLVIIALFVLFGVIAIIFDFIQDAWKLPFAMLVDILDIMAILSPGFLDIIAATASFLVFYILCRDTGFMRYVFGAAGAAKCLIPIPAIGLLPLNTIMMSIAAVIDFK